MSDADQKSILDEDPSDDAASTEDGHGAIESLLDSLRDAGDETVSVEDVVHAFEHRSVGALVAVFGLISALPVVGGVPGASVVTATLILLIVGQSLVTRHGGIWVPRFLGKRELEAETIEKAVDRARPYARRVDRWLRPRLEVLTKGRPQRLVMVIAIIGLALTFYPLELVPWGVTAPSLGVLAFGLALMSGDGYVALFGYAMIVGTIVTALLIF